MRRLKDITLTYKITIEIVQKHFKINRSSYENKPYLLCVKVDKGYMMSSTCFDYSKKGKKELFKFIDEECYLP